MNMLDGEGCYSARIYATPLACNMMALRYHVSRYSQRTESSSVAAAEDIDILTMPIEILAD